MKSAASGKLTILAAAVFCGFFFCLFAFPVTDGDLFWHLATGRWIVEHGRLPASDFLSYTVTDHNPFRPESHRIPFLLKQYWLGQLALFGTWQLAGSAGIVVLRSIVYTGILGFLFCWMRRQNRGLLPLAVALLAGLLLREIPNERPQLFSFVFMPLVLYLLDSIQQSPRQRRLALFGLPLLMLAWSNTHGAYILGVCLIVLAAGPEIVRAVRRQQPLDLHLLVSCLTAIAVTGLNPAGFLAWQELFLTNSAYSVSVYENLTPWFTAVRLHDWHPAYWLFLVVCLTTTVGNWRQMEPRHLLILAGLAVLSLSALRYLAFLLLAAPLLARYLPEIPWRPRNVAALLLVCTVWLGCTWDRSLLGFRVHDRFPRAAAGFLKEHRPAPQLFNYYDWGGYISWFAPDLKTFIDGRGLIEELSLLQDRTMNGDAWAETLDRYGVNTVVIPGMSETPGTVYPLATLLADARDWRLVYADDTAVVFVRDVPANSELIRNYALDRRMLYVHLVKSAERLIAYKPGQEDYWLTKANALQLLGEYPAAREAYRKVLKINPGNEWAKRMLALKVN